MKKSGLSYPAAKKLPNKVRLLWEKSLPLTGFNMDSGSKDSSTVLLHPASTSVPDAGEKQIFVWGWITQLDLRTGSNHTSQHVAETIAKILHFRLSCPPWDDCWKGHLGHTTEKPLIVKEDEPVSDAHWDHNPTQFGLCHYQ
ncbi:hypothetical protein ILYODFUR_020619, partial [Ilyodon furcidens]